MIPRECKRLAEVDFPIAEVSRHSVREKSIRHGHPSTLHLWWARRPLAACRAMLMALLLPDPCDAACPGEFKTTARRLLADGAWKAGGSDLDLRQALLRFIGDFANWDNAAKPLYLEIARGLVKAAHREETPLVVDPFAGGGSIPLEALRVGCDAFASDLNPVACLILKVMLEDIPRHGPKLAEELRRAGEEIRKQAEKELAEFYPPDPDGATPIAYLWARTVRCESPNCGAEIPLVRSFWLCKKPKRRRALRYRVVRPRGKPPRVEFEIFEPASESEVPPGTVSGSKATCPACNLTLPPERVRAQLAAQRGGADVLFDEKGNRIGGARLLAVVVPGDKRGGRAYRLHQQHDLHSPQVVHERLRRFAASSNANSYLGETLSPVRPSPNTRGVSAPTRYGVRSFADLFNQRQRLALLTISELLTKSDASPTVCRLLAICLDKVVMQCNSHCRWKATGESVVDMFGRHAISMVWDFAESMPLGNGTGGWEPAVRWVADAVEGVLMANPKIGQVAAENACKHPLPDSSVDIWFTDPPYYDNIPYADLSDFFFVWLKHSLAREHTLGRSEAGLTPKTEEAVWNRCHKVGGVPKSPQYFERAIAEASAEGRRETLVGGCGCVVFAHKTTEGWEALLSGITGSGWVVTGSWPITTELSTRVSARNSASLATSVHLVCRPRTEDTIGDWGEVLRELPGRVTDWMDRLQREGVRGADLVFACIGPALEIFSRYSKVETAEGREVTLAEYLEKIWEVVGKAALAQVLGTGNGDGRSSAAGGLEEDARLTALFLWTLQATNGESNHNGNNGRGEEDTGDEDDEAPASGKKKAGLTLIFDVVRRFAQPLGIHLPDWEGRIIETKKGVVRLLPIRERAKQLFGEAGADVAADQIEQARLGPRQLDLFAQLGLGDNLAAVPEIRPRGKGRGRRGRVRDEELRSRREATTLDRVHAAMLLQAGGRANALRAMLKAETERSPDFLRLANALSALYPKKSEEKRLLDAMLLAAPR